MAPCKTWKKWKNGEVLIWMSDLPKYLIFQPFLWILWNIHFLVKIDSDKLQKKLELILFGKKVRNIPSDRSEESGYVHYRYFTEEKKHFQIGKFCVSSRQSFPKGMRDHFLFACFGGNSVMRDLGARGQGITILEQQKQICFKLRSRFVSCDLDSVLGHPFLTQHAQLRPFISGVPEAMHKSRLRALKGCRVGSERPSRVKT